MKGWSRRAFSVFGMLLLTAAVSTAQTSRPGSGNAFDDKPIRRSHATADAPTTRDANSTAASISQGRSRELLDLPRVLYSLGIVLAIIFVLRAVAKRFFPGVAGGRGSGGAVRVLSRSPITAKQQVLLVQVGRRVLVVADNGTQMSALSQITDPDEVAQLVGQISGSAASDKEAFNAALGSAEKEFEVMSEPPPSEPAEAQAEAMPQVGLAENELTGLMEKVRGLARQLGK